MQHLQLLNVAIMPARESGARGARGSTSPQPTLTMPAALVPRSEDSDVRGLSSHMVESLRLVPWGGPELKEFEKHLAALSRILLPNFDFDREPIHFGIIDDDSPNACYLYSGGRNYVFYTKAMILNSHYIQNDSGLGFVHRHELEHFLFRRKHGEHLNSVAEEVACDIRAVICGLREARLDPREAKSLMERFEDKKTKGGRAAADWFDPHLDTRHRVMFIEELLTDRERKRGKECAATNHELGIIDAIRGIAGLSNLYHASHFARFLSLRGDVSKFSKRNRIDLAREYFESLDQLTKPRLKDLARFLRTNVGYIRPSDSSSVQRAADKLCDCMEDRIKREIATCPARSMFLGSQYTKLYMALAARKSRLRGRGLGRLRESELAPLDFLTSRTPESIRKNALRMQAAPRPIAVTLTIRMPKIRSPRQVARHVETALASEPREAQAITAALCAMGHYDIRLALHAAPGNRSTIISSTLFGPKAERKRIHMQPVLESLLDSISSSSFDLVQDDLYEAIRVSEWLGCPERIPFLAPEQLISDPKTFVHAYHWLIRICDPFQVKMVEYLESAPPEVRGTAYQKLVRALGEDCSARDLLFHYGRASLVPRPLMCYVFRNFELLSSIQEKLTVFAWPLGTLTNSETKLIKKAGYLRDNWQILTPLLGPKFARPAKNVAELVAQISTLTVEYQGNIGLKNFAAAIAFSLCALYLRRSSREEVSAAEGLSLARALRDLSKCPLCGHHEIEHLIRRFFRLSLLWGQSPTVAIDAWVELKALSYLPVKLDYKWLDQLVDQPAVLSIEKRQKVLASLLTRHRVVPFRLRNKIADLWIDSVLHCIGTDDGTASYARKLENMAFPVLRLMNSFDRFEVSDRLSRAIIAQHSLARRVEQLNGSLEDEYGGNFTELFLAGVGFKIFTSFADEKPKLRRVLCEFLLSHHGDSTYRRFLRRRDLRLIFDLPVFEDPRWTVRTLHENFQLLPQEIRGMIVNHLILAMKPGTAEWDKTVEYCKDRIVPAAGGRAAAMRRAISCYLGVLPEYSRAPYLAQAVVAASEHLSEAQSEMESLGVAIAAFLESEGPAGIRLEQLFESAPGVHPALRRAFRSSKLFPGKLRRLQELEAVSEALPKEMLERLYIGRNLGYGAYLITMETRRKEAPRIPFGALQVLRPHARERAARGYDMFGRALSELARTSPQDEAAVYGLFGRMLALGKSSLSQETSFVTLARLTDELRDLVHAQTLVVDGRAVKNEGPRVLEAGEKYLHQKLQPGSALVDLVYRPSEGQDLFDAIEAVAVLQGRMLLRAKRRDLDRHFGNINYDSGVLYHFDGGGVRLEELSRTARKMLGAFIGESLHQVLRSKDQVSAQAHVSDLISRFTPRGEAECVAHDQICKMMLHIAEGLDRLPSERRARAIRNMFKRGMHWEVALASVAKFGSSWLKGIWPLAK